MSGNLPTSQENVLRAEKRFLCAPLTFMAVLLRSTFSYLGFHTCMLHLHMFMDSCMKKACSVFVSTHTPLKVVSDDL